MKTQSKTNVDASRGSEELSKRLKMTQLQLVRTRRMNSSLWMRINHGAMVRDEGGRVVVNDAERQKALLESENLELRTQLTSLEKRFDEISHTNSELWKRVNYAESQAGLTVRRMVGGALRRIGLLRR